MEKQPLVFKQFIKMLTTLQVYVSPLGQPGDVFVIYQRGGGYGQTPSGPSCPFVCRDANEMVPLEEVEKTLKLIEASGKEFWTIEDHSAPAKIPELTKPLELATGSEKAPEPAQEQPSIEVKPPEPSKE